jgi:hypothetical protein
MTLIITRHDKGQMTQQLVEVPGPVAAAEAILRVGVTETLGLGFSVQGAPITAKTTIDQPGTEIEVHRVPVFG